MNRSERLTEVRESTEVSGVELKCSNAAALHRLAEYENTGLSPEEINKIMQTLEPITTVFSLLKMFK